MGSNRNRSLRRALLIAAVVLVATPAVVTIVSAHGTLQSSTPGNAAELDETPDTVTLEFGGDGIEPLDVTVTHENGTVVSGQIQQNGQVVTIPIQDAGTGIYTVEWEIRSADGHTKTGSLFFAVGDGVLDREAVLQSYLDDGTAGGGDSGSLTFLEAVSKGLLLVSLMVLIGTPVSFGLVVFPVLEEYGVRDEQAHRRAKITLLCGAAGFLGAVGLQGLVRGSFRLAGVRAYAATGLGQRWLWTLLLAAIVALVLADAYRRDRLPRAYWLSVAFLGGLLGSLSVAIESHSASIVGAVDGALVDLLHLAAGGLWAGGLLVLTTTVPPVLRRAHRRAQRPVTAAIIWRFSIVTVAVITMAVTTGLSLAAWHVPSTGSLLDTLYGTTLSLKLLLVALALGLGGFARFYLLRRLRPGATPLFDLRRVLGGSPHTLQHDGGERSNPLALFVRAVRLESGVLLTVILLSGLLTSTPTAAVAADGAVDDRATIERELTTGQVLELGLTPVDDSGSTLATTADTSIVIDAAIRAGGSRRPIDEGQTIRADVTSDRQNTTVGAALEPNDVGGYSAILQVPAGGSWELLVTTTIDDTYVAETVALDVRDDAAGTQDDDSSTSGGLFTTGLSIGALLISLVGMGAVMVEIVRFEQELQEIER
jgi:copper transport protein